MAHHPYFNDANYHLDHEQTEHRPIHAPAMPIRSRVFDIGKAPLEVLEPVIHQFEALLDQFVIHDGD